MTYLYCTEAEMQQARNDGLIRAATPNEIWLHEQLDRIAPDRGEQGHDGADVRALEVLVFELKAKLDALEAV